MADTLLPEVYRAMESPSQTAVASWGSAGLPNGVQPQVGHLYGGG